MVDGNTQVSIGTEKYVLINTIAAGDDLTDKNYYTRSGGAGTEESPYVYEKATGTASANTEYYALVKGANIVGNVYGGGNEADVTGQSNVVIGKETTQQNSGAPAVEPAMNNNPAAERNVERNETVAPATVAAGEAIFEP